MICKDCGESKPLCAFPHSTGTAHKPICRTCESNRERVRKRMALQEARTALMLASTAMREAREKLARAGYGPKRPYPVSIGHALDVTTTITEGLTERLRINTES